MSNISEFIINLITNTGIYGPFFSCILIFIESIFPIMPLSVFITINFIAFGDLMGFIISWVFTILGCLMSFYIFRKGIQGKFIKLTENKQILNKFMDKFNNISVGELIILISIPFAPAFLINIAAGLSKISFRKFLISIFFGKIILVYYWGYIGTNLVGSFNNPFLIIKIIIITLITYFISKILGKKFNL